MAGEVLMGWGPHRFTVGHTAYERLLLSVSARWERHPIIGRRPAGQYFGPDDEDVVLEGTVYPIDMAGGEAAQALALRTDCSGGKVFTLLSADGTVIGPYRLESAEMAETHHLPDGRAQKITYRLEFSLHEGGEGQVFSAWP